MVHSFTVLFSLVWFIWGLSDLGRKKIIKYSNFQIILGHVGTLKCIQHAGQDPPEVFKINQIFSNLAFFFFFLIHFHIIHKGCQTYYSEYILIIKCNGYRKCDHSLIVGFPIILAFTVQICHWTGRYPEKRKWNYSTKEVCQGFVFPGCFP